MGAAPQLSSGTTARLGYPLEDDGFYDEAFEAPRVPRAPYRDLMALLGGLDLADLATAVSAGVEKQGVSFGSGATAEPFHVDPVPRVMDASEWQLVERGLAQRVRALAAFIADVYGDRSIVAAGVVPERAIETCVYFEPWMIGVDVPAWAYTAVAGMDLVRGTDGLLAVLEDNLRTPSGLTYASAARTAVDGALPGPRRPPGARSTRPTTRSAPPCARRRSTVTASPTWSCSPTARRTAPGTSTGCWRGAWGCRW